MEPDSTSLADRFRLALESCELARPKADATPVISEAKTWSAVPFSTSPSREPVGPGGGQQFPEPAVPRAHVCHRAAGLIYPPQQRPHALPPTIHPGASSAYELAPPQPTQSSGVIKLVAVVLASLALAALAFFLRKKILRRFWGGGTAAPEEDVESDDDSRPAVLFGRERSFRRATPLRSVSHGLLPQACRRSARSLPAPREQSRAGETKQPPTEKTTRPGRTEVVALRKVRIQDPPPEYEDDNTNESLRQYEAQIDVEGDPNFEEL